VENSKYVTHLYQKYLDNTCSMQELQEVLCHFEQNELDSGLKVMIRQELTGSGEEYAEMPQVQAILSKLDLSMNEKVLKSEGNRIRLVHRIPNWYWSAAVLFLIVSVAIYYANTRINLFNTYMSEYKNDVAPGSDKAYLTLADGKRVELNDSVKGPITNQSGVLITKTASGQLRYEISNKDRSASKNVYNTISTPKGGKFEVILSDGTKVFLNSSSSIKFPSSFPASGERKVTLKGEGYFEVAHNKNQPFYVQSRTQLLKVLGTHFNVNAYTDEKSVKTTLMQGAVKIDYEGGLNAVLKPGEESYIYNGKLLVKDVNANSAIDWKRGEMNLEDEDFQSTMRKIARWYDVEVVFEEDAPVDLRLGGLVSTQKSLVTVLKVMELTGEVHFKVEGRRVTVKK
jgi:transmembrane sensor